jgi:ElaB/YqjD/DUF883 family membrane-anchored ribosome-binding protein
MTQANEASGRQQGLTDQASAKVHDAAAAAQDKASELREQGTSRLRDQFDQRSSQAGSQVRSLAEALRHSGNDLRHEGNANVAQLTGQAAERIERIGSYLEQKRGDDLMRDVEMFARRRPWMLTGLGVLAGMGAARFVKASSEQRYGEYGRTQPQQWPTNRSGLGSGVPSPLSDDPLARDPYAGTR